MTKADNPLVSVVVPVYNVERYIDKCIGSIIDQSYINLEIILVDDGSPDNSGEKCDEWAKKDKRIKVVHKPENGGLFQARVSGFEIMKGDYFIIVDSDDYIDLKFVEELLQKALTSNADIVIANKFSAVDASSVVTSVVTMPKIYTTSDVFDGLMNKISKEVWGWSIWSKMYKSSIYSSSRKDISLVKGKINAAEDALYAVIFAKYAKSTAYMESYFGYFYRQNDKSITKNNTVDSYINGLQSINDVLFEVRDFLLRKKVLGAHLGKFDSFKSHLLSNYVWGMHNDEVSVLDKLKSKNGELEIANEELEAKSRALNRDLERVLSSRTYRLGKLIVAPYKKVRRMLE